MLLSRSKFKGKYRTASDRLKDWDYGAASYYFITICIKSRMQWLGEIRNNQFIASQAGEITRQELTKISQIRTNIDLDLWIVMPNHVHAIIVIREPEVYVETPRRGVSTNRNWRPGVLGVIINQYKSSCTKHIRAMGCTDFAWQAGYYDHIIRNIKSLDNIRTYILENPLRWTDDEYFGGR